MKKSESIEYMKKLGLNTLDCLVTNNVEEAHEYLKNTKAHQLSMRTEKGSNDFSCPFYYNYTKINLLMPIEECISNGYTLILYPFLDWRDSLAFGTIGMPKDGRIIVEFVMEPGLVRSLDTHKNRRSLILPQGLQLVEGNVFVNEVVREVKAKCYDEPPCIVEWSYYRDPVGNLNKRPIFWEIRKYA